MEGSNLRHIIAYSGGVSSAYTIKLVLEKYPDAIIYFNDTKWEHEDLYRFNKDIEKLFNIKITEDSDGRNPEQLFMDIHFLGNNKVPCCSVELKAKRLQKFASPGDNLYFGIGIEEIHRAARIRSIYTPKGINTYFPLIENKINKETIFTFFKENKIEIPYLYKIGFSHNNCSGGCVRAGKKSWINLYRMDKKTYLERENLEIKFNKKFGGNNTFLGDITLKELRERIEYENRNSLLWFENNKWNLQDDEPIECIGMCGNLI